MGFDWGNPIIDEINLYGGTVNNIEYIDQLTYFGGTYIWNS